jgi:hypothetical protein
VIGCTGTVADGLSGTEIAAGSGASVEVGDVVAEVEGVVVVGSLTLVVVGASVVARVSMVVGGPVVAGLSVAGGASVIEGASVVTGSIDSHAPTAESDIAARPTVKRRSIEMLRSVLMWAGPSTNQSRSHMLQPAKSTPARRSRTSSSPFDATGSLGVPPRCTTGEVGQIERSSG